MTRDWQDDQPYHRSGSGETVVLIHGFTSSWHIWKPVIGVLERDYDVLALTMPGHLGWPWPEGVEVSMQAMVDLVAERLASLGVERAYVVGNSLGGALALWMASQDKTSLSIGVAPAMGWPSGAIDVGRLFRAAAKNVRGALPQAEEILGSVEMRQQLLAMFMNHGERVPLDEAVRMWDAVVAVEKIDEFAAVLNTFELPTLTGDQKAALLWCADDKLIPYVGGSEGWREHAPHAPSVVLHELGHSPMYDDPERVADAIRTAISAS